MRGYFGIGIYHIKTEENIGTLWKSAYIYISSVQDDCWLVGIKQSGYSLDLKIFHHPERCIYLLGAEDHGLSQDIMDKCQRIVHIDTSMCLNVAVAGSIVMYDRATNRGGIK